MPNTIKTPALASPHCRPTANTNNTPECIKSTYLRARRCDMCQKHGTHFLARCCLAGPGSARCLLAITMSTHRHSTRAPLGQHICAPKTLTRSRGRCLTDEHSAIGTSQTCHTHTHLDVLYIHLSECTITHCPNSESHRASPF